VTDFLSSMAEASRARVSIARDREADHVLRQRALSRPSPLRLTRHPDGFDLIAEIKRRSPSAGVLIPSHVVQQAAAYASAGVMAISVLTEPDAFDGSLADLERVATAVQLPIMRKDFLVDPYQLLEARAAGASGALMIVRMLETARLIEMLETAAEMDLFILLEAFDEADLTRIAGILPRAGVLGLDLLVGLNCRDLRTLEVNPACFDRLRGSFPPGVTRVAESGVTSAEDIGRLAGHGYSAALVGRALMQSADPAALAIEMLRTGRLKGGRSCQSG